MEKSIFEQMGGTYHQQGNYLLPDHAIPETISVGIWGHGIYGTSGNTARAFTPTYR